MSNLSNWWIGLMMKFLRILRLFKFVIMEENNKIFIYMDSEGLIKIDVILEDEILWFM